MILVTSRASRRNRARRKSRRRRAKRAERAANLEIDARTNDLLHVVLLVRNRNTNVHENIFIVDSADYTFHTLQ